MMLKPTITYPIGGEDIHESLMTITWAGGGADDGVGYEYEVFFTDIYNIEEEPDWVQIASIPSSATQVIWDIPSHIRSNRVRVAVRTKSIRGERSDFSISGANLSIKRRNLTVPAVLSPVSSSSYDKYIEIILDYASIKGTYSQRSYLQLSYSSQKANISITALAQDVPIYTKSIIWNTIDLTPSDDYILYVTLSDSDGNVSDTLQIKNINISHEGYFIIDTTPPVSSLVVNDGSDFTKNRDVNVQIVSFDETTGVHSMQLLEGSNKANPEPIANVKSFELSDQDGTKVVELLLQDFGANRNDNQTYRLFDTVMSGTNPVVDATYLNDGSVWVIVGNAKTLYQIDEYPVFVLSLTNEPTAISSFNNQIYLATVSDLNQGTLNRYTGASSIEIIMEFDIPDSNITCMISHYAILYIGMQNGSVYAYDGATIFLVDQLPNPIASMSSDGSSLYLALRNSDNAYVLNSGSFIEVG